MSEMPNTVHIPVWTQADRLRKALDDADISVQQMAEFLEVSRNTVTNWTRGHTPIPGAALRLWAMRCGVPLEWLRHGVASSEATDGSVTTTDTKWRFSPTSEMSDFRVPLDPVAA